MKVNQFNSDNINRLVKIQKYLNENYDINVGKILPQKKLDTAYKNVEQRIANLRNKGSKFQQDPNYGMNIMVRDALGIMINEGMYYEGENYRKLMDELYEYGCSLAESGDDYDTVMASCGKKYEVMPARFPKEMIMASLGEQIAPMFEGPLAGISGAVAGAQLGGAVGGIPGALAGATLGHGITKDREVTIKQEGNINELDTSNSDPEEVFAKHLGKALNRKDWQNRTIGELFSELESVSVDMADKYHDAYDIAMKKAGKEPMNFKESRDEFDSFLDDVVDGMVTEEIAGTSVEEAEVVMAARALSNDIQDHIERLGRMVNEDIPAIADSMSHEFGLEKAQSFKTGMEELLASTLDANKACKDGIDNILGGITGEGSVADAPVDGMGDMGAMDEPALDDVPMDNFDGADAEAGPLEEPLGRLEKE
jgi:hypothetical protein